MPFLKWFAQRAIFLAFAVSLIFTIAGVKYLGGTLKHDWVMKHGTAQQGMISVWRPQRGACTATVNFQLGPDDAPRVDVFASSALCDAIGGKSDVQVPIHFVARGPFKGMVVLDNEYRAEPTLMSHFPRRSWPWLFFLWFMVPMIAIGIPAAVRRGSKRSPRFKRFVAFLTAQR